MAGNCDVLVKTHPELRPGVFFYSGVGYFSVILPAGS